MHRPQVSVTMPCHNCEGTLPAALDSLLAQTHHSFEVVCVDDGSADGTADILREYARRDSRVRALFVPHGGVVAAANAAIDAARGRYVARMDADDLSLPDRLAAQAALLDAHDDVGLAGCRVRFGGDTDLARGYALYVEWTNGLLTPEEIALNRFVEFPVPNPSIMVRRSVLERHGAYRDGDYPEDYEFFLRLQEAGVRMAKCDEELLVWNDPPDRLSRNHPKYDVDAFYRVKAEYLSRWLAAHNPHHPEVFVLGAGRRTRRRADLLLEHGVAIGAYYDIDPRKIGNVIDGRPVLDRTTMPGPDSLFCLAYVGSRGARELIDEFFAARGAVPGVHYLHCA